MGRKVESNALEIVKSVRVGDRKKGPGKER